MAGYRAGAARLREVYEAVDPGRVLAPVSRFLHAPGRVLDIGAGTGLHGAWLRDRGHSVLAAEPVAALLVHDLDWIDARLPALDGVAGRFDVILLSAVWHHLDPAERRASWPRIAQLLEPGGTALLSLRHGPCPADRPGWPCDVGRELAAAGRHGLERVHVSEGGSVQAANVAAGIAWTWLALRPRVGG